MIRLLNNKKTTAAIIATVIAAAAGIGGYSVSSNAAMAVDAYTVDFGGLESEIEVNGTVESNKDMVCYSEIAARVGKIHVKEGDFVKKGDLIISYDLEELERLETMTDLQAKADLGSYNNSVQTGNRTAGLYGEAKRNLATLEQQISDTQEAITRTQNALTERKAALADFGAKLQISLIDWADQPDSDEYENLQKLVQTNAYEQQYAPDIVKLQEELNVLNVQLANLKEYKAEMTSQKASTVMNLMTEGAKEQLEAVKEANDISNNEKLADYAAAKEGIKAEFDGIITQIGVIEGSDIARGTNLFTLKSSSDIIIKSTVNKYDIVNIEEGQPASVNIKNKDYQGVVSRIERMTKDSGTGTGIGVEITLLTPDDDIILGLEAKSKIYTASLTQVLRVPVEALSEDEEGSYVFVAKDGKAEKVFVECGIRNDDMVEITDGLDEGTLVVWKDSEELSEGMGVKVK
ncbi:efflux RND transporter periplasmic adaptor subunit [Butyrivibrio sp. DSM 10294]|uniref:efflux RND transporter periplasmic adaptor subunit n=1 Tax=Butyrivibrio sp. DSM 10294 TaxID=2972457 RepID=UPI00234F3E8B|nr:efflux RND transporter periplasmic adaptor subunit [Butyrivibrio sp. DSM 10294]MDC7292324.1 efflux RND transporter periplasmic adaptor subunit [Butyrivibrio sp. DSM 10294]